MHCLNVIISKDCSDSKESDVEADNTQIHKRDVCALIMTVVIHQIMIK